MLVNNTLRAFSMRESKITALYEQYAKEHSALYEEIKGLEAIINGYEQSRKSADKSIALVEKYENFDRKTMTI